MSRERATSRREKRTPRPLDDARLRDLALAYVARFATSAGKLRAYLRRKLRERGWEGEGEPPVEELVARFVEKSYVDDAAYGRAKAQGLLARGYGARRVEEALRAADIDEATRSDLAPEEHERRVAVVALARRRGFGPYATNMPESALERGKLKEKRLAALLRAGHEFAHARHVLEAATIEELEEWVAESESPD